MSEIIHQWAKVWNIEVAEWMDKCMDGCMGGCMHACIHVWMDGRVIGVTESNDEGTLARRERNGDAWNRMESNIMLELLNEWMDGWMEKWVDEFMNACLDECILYSKRGVQA